MKINVVVLTLSLLFSLPGLHAADIRVGFYNAPPLMIEKQNRGIYHDLLQQIGAITGDRFIIRYFSIARLQRLFEEGKLDLEPGINPRWRTLSKTPGLYSIPFATLDQIVLFRPGRAIKITGPDSLVGKQVGAIRGYIYPFFSQTLAQGHIERIDVTDEPQLLQLLEKGRVDQVFTDRVVQGFWAKQNPQLNSYPASASLGNTPVMMRFHPSQADKLEQVNRALALLMRQGTVEQIFSRYR